MNEFSFETLEMNKIQFVNTTLEKFKIQCNSKVYVFEPRSTTMVPYNEAKLVSDHVRHRGVAVIFPTMTEEQKKGAIGTALSVYRKAGTLFNRLKNNKAYMDDFKRRGIEIEKPEGQEEAEIWAKEIDFLLGTEFKTKSNASFLSDAEREVAKIERENAVEIKLQLPSVDKIKVQEKSSDVVAKKSKKNETDEGTALAGKSLDDLVEALKG